MDTNSQNAASANSERRKLENEIFSFEGEKRSFEKKQEVIIDKITRLKKEIVRMESEITDLEISRNTCKHRILDATEEIARLKRRMNLL